MKGLRWLPKLLSIPLKTAIFSLLIRSTRSRCYPWHHICQRVVNSDGVEINHQLILESWGILVEFGIQNLCDKPNPTWQGFTRGNCGLFRSVFESTRNIVSSKMTVRLNSLLLLPKRQLTPCKISYSTTSNILNRVQKRTWSAKFSYGSSWLSLGQANLRRSVHQPFFKVSDHKMSSSNRCSKLALLAKNIFN